MVVFIVIPGDCKTLLEAVKADKLAIEMVKLEVSSFLIQTLIN
jgi:hypothetical protein